MPRSEAYRFILSAHGLRAGDVRALRQFEMGDQEACQLLIQGDVRGRQIEEVVQNNQRLSRRNAVRQIAGELLKS